MDILLWILQILLALHTIVGAVWKFSNSERVIPECNSSRSLAGDKRH
jgi:hypothetical protein